MGKEFAGTKETFCKFYVCLPVFSSDTMVQSKRKAEKAKIHSGSEGFYHNERYTETLKKE